jgi:hypothetical protein
MIHIKPIESPLMPTGFAAIGCSLMVAAGEGKVLFTSVAIDPCDFRMTDL